MAPGVPAPAEHVLRRGKMNSYGKAWHLWNTAPCGRSGDRMPTGKAKLQWWFSRDGEALPGLVERRDQRLGVSSTETRKARADLKSLAKPQAGDDAQKRALGPHDSLRGAWV